MAKSPYFLFNRERCFRVTMPPLHPPPAAKECQMSNFRGVSRSSLFSVTNGNSNGWHMQRCTTCSGGSRHSDKGGGGREGERGGSHPDPEIRGMLSLKKKNFRLSRPQFGLKTFGPSPRSDTDMAAVWFKVACIAIGIVSRCKVLAEELRSGDWVELWNFLTSTRIVTKMVASSPKL